MAISCTSISAVLESQGASLRVFSQLVYNSNFKVHSHQSCLLQITLCSVCCFRSVRSDHTDLFRLMIVVCVRFIQHTTVLIKGGKVFASVNNIVFITILLDIAKKTTFKL